MELGVQRSRWSACTPRPCLLVGVKSWGRVGIHAQRLGGQRAAGAGLGGGVGARAARLGARGGRGERDSAHSYDSRLQVNKTC